MTTAQIEGIRELARVIQADENTYRSLDDSAEFTWAQAIAAAKEELGHNPSA
jgi:hypothetical protein